MVTTPLQFQWLPRPIITLYVVVIVVSLTITFGTANIDDINDSLVNRIGDRLIEEGAVQPLLPLRPGSGNKGRRPGVVGPQVPGGPPKRPRNFKSVQELHNYLEALRDYYAVLGRPRYDLRQVL